MRMNLSIDSQRGNAYLVCGERSNASKPQLLCNAKRPRLERDFV